MENLEQELPFYKQVVIDHIDRNRLSIIMHSRETGILQTFAYYMLETMLKRTVNIILVSTKKDSYTSILSHVVEYYKQYASPDDPAININNKNLLTFSNNSVIRCYKAHKNSIIRFTDADYVFFTDMALDIDSEVSPVYTKMFVETQAIGKCKIILSSTPNGFNLFYELFSKAELPSTDSQKNAYAALRLYYFQVPGRDYKWIAEKILQIGEEAFNNNYNLCFTSKSNFKMGSWVEPKTIPIPNNVESITVTYNFKKQEDNE